MRFVVLCLLFFGLHYQGIWGKEAVYENLVFEGAGIRGLAYSGVIQVLEEQRLLGQIKRVGGTSAGAITALLLALGYTSTEIYALVDQTPFQKFNDGQYAFIGGWNRFRKQYGWYRKKAVENWLAKLIEQKVGNAAITFQQLKLAGYKSLYVTGTCVNQQKLIVFSADTYPNMKVIDAVSASLSIPLYFQASFIDSTGKVYSAKKRAPAHADVVIDGGLLGNFPIAIFDELDTTFQPPLRLKNYQTLGIRIDDLAQIELDKKGNNELVPAQIHNWKQYLEAMYVLTLERINRNTLLPQDWERTISVSSCGIGPRIKKLSYNPDFALDSLWKAKSQYRYGFQVIFRAKE